MVEDQEIAIIIGAGPAGLTAAYELLNKTNIKPIILEKTGEIGGISKTVNYKGNRIDIGGHRFFSKSDRIMKFWKSILPLQCAPAHDDLILNREVQLSEPCLGQGLKSGTIEEYDVPDPEKTDNVMLNRSRVSRIYFLRKFFDYPVSLTQDTLKNLGFKRTFKIGMSYISTVLTPSKPEKSLEDFFINRFGRELYQTFFKDYTEKVWGVQCCEIKADWGAQRIKGLSIQKTLENAVKSKFSNSSNLSQKDVETSLIGQFMYPKFGPGQIWEELAARILEKGGEIHHYQEVEKIVTDTKHVTTAETMDLGSGKTQKWVGNYFISTMPVKDLIQSFDNVPEDVADVAGGLIYRDFITVGLLLNQLKIKNESELKTINNLVPDNWIYIQERDVKIGRLQIFNNWSPYLVNDPDKVWIGLEYFCNEGDDLWSMSKSEFTEFAVDELVKIGIIKREDVLDSVVLKVEKTYPAYFGSYHRFNIIRDFTDEYENLYLIGRNGMHRYNNMDHSMLTAITAVENIVKGVRSKNNIWNINAEEDYHEE